ncbi:MAG: hypothetical protein KGL39_31015 [Patescibacteria group bacterium]|nr:hypothetical protein [Patescibacteria group bacterium]
MPSSPCNDCPWRRDAPPGHWHPDHFDSIWAGCQDDGLSVMLCHKAAKLPEAERDNLPCRGWLLVMGCDAIGVRLLLLKGKIAPADLKPARGCPPLYATFEEMLRANGVEPGRRNRYKED